MWLKDASFKDRLHVAIDGKVSRSSADGSGNPLYTVSAYRIESHLVIGQEKTPGNTHEITAIPKLIKYLDVKDAIVTINAMGCQTSIAQDVREAGADYILCLKGNHSKLLAVVQNLFASDSANKIFSHSTSEKSHGREEERDYKVMACPEELKQEYQWEALNSLIEVKRERTVKGITSVETIYYISSLDPKVKTIAHGR